MIGVIGGHGAVGARAARILARWGVGPLRIGGRNPHPLPEGLVAEQIPVDVTDEASLARFVRGCRVVVNCSGPSHLTAERVAGAAVAAGAHHVDAGGEPFDLDCGDRSVVLNAGALPGLSGLLPRWLAGQGFDAVHTLTAYAAVLDRFTGAGAEDYLHGVLGEANEPLAAWDDGTRRGAARTRLAGLRLPYLPRPVTALPYLDAEGEELAEELSLRTGTWYSVLDGERLGIALDAARTLARPEAVARLCRATALDVAGRQPYATLLVQLDGRANGSPVSRTAVVRSGGIAELTGAVTAVAARAVLGGEVPPGVRPAATALDPRRALENLRELCELTVTQARIDELMNEEEGVL
ncbi:saccharopine dehydrogenase NADP-binding domain-containing protein [Kitasatospora paracochleata]|uniref:Saccharopine dehydrogenase NADP binding domain-containing protein n=1 Tax=Kitasatospora paracochleata TaxID=58354 RepID=A0ABT1IWF1_9ACTN|nr:saccharopine dehydrogenase NADP-binding domain-containing protein [Kitasatospora paracochleata]MCP2309467.1 hypothetical protein [Kitasatospora paracochleata]